MRCANHPNDERSILVEMEPAANEAPWFLCSACFRALLRSGEGAMPIGADGKPRKEKR